MTNRGRKVAREVWGDDKPASVILNEVKDLVGRRCVRVG